MLLSLLHAFARRSADRLSVFRRTFVVGVVCLVVLLVATAAGSVTLVTTLNNGGDLTVDCKGTSLTQTRLSPTRRQLRCTGTTTTTPTPPQPSGSAVRAAFYYGWYPSTWGSGSNFHPTAGQYSSTDATVVRQHVADAQYANVDAFIASWWGAGTPTDKAFPTGLRASDGTSVKWALYYEAEGYSNPSSSLIGGDLSYLSKNYAADPNYLHRNGKPVLFVYGDGTDGCGTVDRWRAATGNADWYIVLKVFGGYRTCAQQPDSWHQYGPAARSDRQAGYSFSVSPGFWKSGESVRLARDPAAFATAVQAMVASGEPWQLVTTWNEWGEGSPVEPAAEYGRTYLDILHNNGNAAPAAPQPPPPPPPSSALQPVSHVIVISEENRTWSGVGLGFSTMPYLRSVGGLYFPDWTETNTSENSLTQYIGVTSGRNDPDGIANDCSPSATCRTTADNIFRQVRAAGGTPRSYVEGATTGCSASGNAAKHIPALYYFGGTDHDFCATEVRPLGEFDPNNPPTFAFITPNLCNDGHDCSNATVDSWLSTHLPAILNSAAYQNGSVLVNIWYDEDRPVPNLALRKGIASGSNAAVASDGRLLATWEDLLHLPALTSAPSLRSVYGF
jgi:hypothetical protein